jgi:hypothetical protein
MFVRYGPTLRSHVCVHHRLITHAPITTSFLLQNISHLPRSIKETQSVKVFNGKFVYGARCIVTLLQLGKMLPVTLPTTPHYHRVQLTGTLLTIGRIRQGAHSV